MKRILAVLLFALIAASSRAGEILVFGAASLTESLQEIGKLYESKTGTVVRFSFGASSDLARQIQAGAPADVFFSADTAKMDALERAGLVHKEDRREFLSNVLVVVVSNESNLRISSLQDLVGLRRLALADPTTVPAGIYAKKWLEIHGLWKQIEPNVIPVLDVRAALAAVESGGAPAAIVYRTDAAISRKVRIAYEVRDGPTITYSAAPIAGRSARARVFSDFLESADARDIFVRRGFVIKSASN